MIVAKPKVMPIKEVSQLVLSAFLIVSVVFGCAFVSLMPAAVVIGVCSYIVLFWAGELYILLAGKFWRTAGVIVVLFWFTTLAMAVGSRIWLV